MAELPSDGRPVDKDFGPWLTHVLYDRCENELCPVHNPIGAPEMEDWEISFYLAGAQTLLERYLRATNEELGLDADASSPSQRLRAIVSEMRERTERFAYNQPKKPKKGAQIKRKGRRRALNVFR